MVLFFCVTVISARSFLAWKQGLKKIKLIRSVCKERTSSFFVFRVRLLEPKVRYYRTPLLLNLVGSRDHNLYITSLKKEHFFFSCWSHSTCSVILGRKIVLQLLQESSMTIERQNCCFVEKQLHLSNKSLRVFR